MSNKLKRKKKPIEPEGYSKENIKAAGRILRQIRNTENFVEDSYLNIKLIAYQILHDKFGFGQKRIARVNGLIDEKLREAAENELRTKEQENFMKEKCGIDVRDEANKVPFRERFAISSYRVNMDSMQSAGMYLLASICNFFSLIGICLKTRFKFSTRQIKEVYAYIRDYINTLSRYKQFELKIEHIAESVAIECGYIDKRFIGESNGK